MKRLFSRMAIIVLLGASTFVCATSDTESKSSQSVTHGGFELRDGQLFSSKSHSVINAANELVTEFTVSPDGAFLVFVQKGRPWNSIWIFNDKTGKRVQVGQDLDIGCCVFVTDIKNKGLSEVVSFTNGAFWTKKNEVLVKTPGGKGVSFEFFLSMDGKIVGDI